MRVNPDRMKADFKAVNAFNASPGNGITRLTFTDAYMGAYTYVKEELQKIGAQVSIHGAGCLRGRIAGSDPCRPAVASGSHLDTVKNGGAFDGQVGVISALEAARVVVESGVLHRHPLDVVVFPEEEGARFGIGMAGSGVWSGELDAKTLNSARDPEGTTYAGAMAASGLVVDQSAPLRRGELKAMVEVHIEQSVVLDRKDISIGIVSAIAGAKWIDLEITGRADHAGGTPMGSRRDALQGAAHILVDLERIAETEIGPDTVATCGVLNVKPGAANVIARKADMVLDLRDTDAENLEMLASKVLRCAAGTCRERGLEMASCQRFSVPPVSISPDMVRLIDRCSRARGIDAVPMVSGALHDCCKLSGVTDIGMIFVPSKDGRSHTAEEWTDWHHIENGANVLLDVLVDLVR